MGGLLDAAGRSPYRASHLHFMVGAEGHRTLVTHIFVRGDDFLGTDSVFGVRRPKPHARGGSAISEALAVLEGESPVTYMPLKLSADLILDGE
ncbi:hypothetical protein ACFQXA_09055 [Nocardiopsis composta]